MGVSEIFRVIGDGVSMLRAVSTDLKRGVANAFREDILNKPPMTYRMLKRGDIIGISRGYYEHFGIYSGRDRVIHFSSYSSDKSLDNRIQEAPISEFLKDGEHLFFIDPEVWLKKINLIYRNTRKFKMFSPQTTINRARKVMEKDEEEYKLLTNNCEHFAFWCKFGVKHFSQGWVKIGRVYINYNEFAKNRSKR